MAQIRIALAQVNPTVGAIDANFENGILTVQVTLPEVKEVEPKKIPVAAK